MVDRLQEVISKLQDALKTRVPLVPFLMCLGVCDFKRSAKHSTKMSLKFEGLKFSRGEFCANYSELGHPK